MRLWDKRLIHVEGAVADLRQRLYCTEIALEATRETVAALKEAQNYPTPPKGRGDTPF